jgi:hypothetical protein
MSIFFVLLTTGVVASSAIANVGSLADSSLTESPQELKHWRASPI